MSKKYLVTQDQTVDGMPLEGDSVIHYTTCSTAAATVAKTAALSGFKLVTGALAAVKFTVTNTAANPTLNINSTGAKAVRYRNAAVSAEVLAANHIYIMVYDGTYWQIVGDLDNNTVYTHPTTSGNKHIPAGGSANQILTYSSDGTAKWNSSCYAAAIEVVQGERTTTTGSTTVSYKTGRTKALLLGYPKTYSSGYAPFASKLLTGLSNSMTAINNTVVNGFTSSGGFSYSVAENGTITIIGYIGYYCVIWFN